MSPHIVLTDISIPQAILINATAGEMRLKYFFYGNIKEYVQFILPSIKKGTINILYPIAAKLIQNEFLPITLLLYRIKYELDNKHNDLFFIKRNASN
jgi:hypothetical protein